MCTFAGGPPSWISRTDDTDLIGGVICEKVSPGRNVSLAARAFRSIEKLLGQRIP